ncbi:MAG: 6-phosphogluconolactonase [Myxococcota bacterium]
MTDLKVFDSVADLSVALADSVQRWIAEAVEARGVAHVVLAGGSTPASLHAVLAERALPWDTLHFYFGDERCVPPDHSDSNYRAAQETLLSRVPVPEEHVHRMDGEAREQGARSYRAILPDRFDVVLLGMGEDGHTASLFPGLAAVESEETVLYISDSPKPPPERITLGLKPLNGARNVGFMVAGAGKASALSRVRDGEKLPAARVKPDNGTLTFFADRAAVQSEKL